jgi:enterochelin esterase family protein
MKQVVLLGVAAGLLAGAGPVRSQGGGRPGTRLVSPEVHADGTVTVRIRAPRADSVTIGGEILDGKPAPAMVRDTGGVWSATLGPLAPDIYTYVFRVDGVSTPDPVNPYLKLPASTGLASQVEVPGDGPQYYDFRDVPHGIVSIVQYRSAAIGAPRTAWVYTPPNYSQGTRAYPLLLLLHGIGETENSWVMTGRANVILDNLIADGRALPMVVVMPLGHVRQSIGLAPWSAAPAAPAPASAGASPEVFGSATLQRDLLGDLLPLVERDFRVSTNPDDRAIMGLSMGGAQALKIGLDNLDTFHWVIGLSAALVGRDPTAPFADVLADPAAANGKLKLLRLTTGRSDGLLAANQRFDEALTRAGIRHTFGTTEGGHWFRVWRRDLYEIAPVLFR